MAPLASPGSDKDLQLSAVAHDAYSGPVRMHWWRNTLTQAIIVGGASFLGPGMYAALAATGAGGLANIGNASVAIAYALIVPSALIATGFMSKFNCKMALSFGAAGYAPYAAALYTNSKFGTQWYLILGAAICGLTSGVFWVAEGAIIMIYSEPHRKGRLLAVWQSIYVLATVVGGAINLGLNVNVNQPGGLKPNTYIVFVALSCLAPFFALLLSNPHKVQRTDGQPVPPFPDRGWIEEVWLTLKELGDVRVLACAFLWSQSLFIPSYFSTYRAKYFTVRVRGMSSIVIPINGVGQSYTDVPPAHTQVFLDSKMVLRKKLIIAWSAIQLVLIVCCVWQLIDLIDIHRHRGNEKVVYDWDTPGWAAWWLPSVLGHAAQSVSYGYNYYMASFVFPKSADRARVSRIIATLRSAESGSAAIAFGISALKLPLYRLGIINLVFLAVILALGAYLHIWIWINDKAGTIGDAAAHVPAEHGAPELEKGRA